MSSSTMYKMKPVFDFPAPFKHTSSMYKLKNIQFSRTAENSNFLSQDNNVSQNTEIHPEEKLILSRQEKLLVELSKLKDQINAFRLEVDKLKTSKPTMPKSSQASASSTTDEVNYSTLLSEVAAYGIVINANPNYPPYSLFGLSKIWKDLPIQVSVHVHSSVITLPAQLKSFDVLKKSYDNKSKINITLVWKDVGEDCELIISPVKNKIIVGEVNLLRFFNQYLTSDSIPEKIFKDETFDIAHRILHISGNKKLDLTKQLSEKLAKNNFFSNSKTPNIVDLALWSSFKKLKKKDNLPQNLVKWIERSSSHFGVKNV